MDIVLAPVESGATLITLGPDLRPTTSSTVGWPDLGPAVEEYERQSPRWIWAETAALYPRLLRAGTTVGRCFDLRLCHVIVRNATATATSELARSATGPWDVPVVPLDDQGPTLLDDSEPIGAFSADLVLAEYRLVDEAVRQATDPGRLRMLLAAESAGALVAAEMKFRGLPWRTDVHDQQLTELLGPRPRQGGRPPTLEDLAVRIRELLEAPGLNPDSPVELLRALRANGIEATTTRKWELEKFSHPVIDPLLRYKKLSRLLAANGWVWMDSWVRDGRFHPDYVPGGVVTGRWATSGGGALQLPKQIRRAVMADPGCKLVVADAAQLEPRVLAAMSRDERMAEASRGLDLYQGLVDAGIVDNRAHAKVAMLGALYGATSGEAGQLMPRLMRAYPKATQWVEDAARSGERGEVVSTWLGRSSPRPPQSWQQVQRRASEVDAGQLDERLARRRARDWGRFTRNFVVQGTAAEWALCWMANLRHRLRTLARAGEMDPHLVFFLHDEVIVHTPGSLAPAVEAAIHQAADEAGRLLFGSFPVEFAVKTVTVDNYGEAK
ncbi:DNA polymerase-1 [Microlunatus panaciterrae]|uniref:DNA-directed DNA polymerase n=1 Tax=Microlunatus panaciterrae TaxID=400768 RepID=A0ABS2RJB6_9ACTN|nr:DNA polymerase-1 [Microlunatus panaciterrae]